MATVKIILTQTVPKLGTVGSVKEVAAGYARNFLLATNKAVLATPSTLSQVEKNQARLAKEGEIRYQLFQKEIDKLKDVIDGNKSWHASDKQQIYDLKMALGKLQNLEVVNEQYKILIAELKKDNKILARQFDDQLKQFRNKGGL